MKLGVNIDHIATVRQARRTTYPEPVIGALLAQKAGCDSIVAHVREDRRHVCEHDVFLIKEAVKIPLNLEMAIHPSIVSLALQLLPHQATLVPERRQELTTEGGLDLIKHTKRIEKVIQKLQVAGIITSVFIDPIKRQIDYAKKLGANNIEINTGEYSDAKTNIAQKKQLEKIKQAAVYARSKIFFVAAGHGLDYENVKPIAQIKAIQELNIGHAIIGRALFVGMMQAVVEMKQAMNKI